MCEKLVSLALSLSHAKMGTVYRTCKKSVPNPHTYEGSQLVVCCMCVKKWSRMQNAAALGGICMIAT